MKLVRCGCGGDPEYPEFDTGCFILCMECGMSTSVYGTETEAVNAWNRAMGADTEKTDKQ